VKRILFFLFCALFISTVHSQALLKNATIGTNVSSFTIDKLGFIYTVENGNLNRQDSTGNNRQTFSNKNIGNIDVVDATNPFRILIYNKDFSLIYFLDNHLAIQSSINLREALEVDAWPVCSSSDGFWLMDRQQNKLLKYDYTLKNTAQSQPLNLLIADNIHINAMQEGDKWLGALNQGVGIMIFDRLGSYVKTHPAPSATAFLLKENILVYFEKNELIMVDLQKNTEVKRLKCAFENAAQIQWFQGSFYILCNDIVTIFSFKE
jgi:hypothetical protein